MVSLHRTVPTGLSTVYPHPVHCGGYPAWGWACPFYIYTRKTCVDRHTWEASAVYYGQSTLDSVNPYWTDRIHLNVCAGQCLSLHSKQERAHTTTVQTPESQWLFGQFLPAVRRCLCWQADRSLVLVSSCKWERRPWGEVCLARTWSLITT